MPDHRKLAIGPFNLIVVANRVADSHGDLPGYRARFSISRSDGLPVARPHATIVSDLIPYNGMPSPTAEEALDLAEVAGLAEIAALRGADTARHARAA